MATEFKITKLPIRSKMTVQGANAVLDRFYDISLQNQVQIINETGIKGEPFDSFSFKIKEDNVLSKNTGNIVINFPTDKAVPPAVLTPKKVMLIQTSFLFSSLVPPNNSFDRIRILSINGFGEWTYKGNPVVPGTELMYYDLKDELKFTASDVFPFENYSKLDFKRGHIDLFYPEINYIEVSTTSLGAEISNVEYEYELIDGVQNHTYRIDIIKGLSGKNYIAEIDPTLFNIGASAVNRITVKKEDQTIIKTIVANEVSTFTSALSSQGRERIIVLVEKANITTTEESIALKILSVDGNPSNVNLNFNQKTLNIPLINTTEES